MADETKKIAVLIIHGMGNQGADFAEPTITKLKTWVRRKGGDENKIVFQSVHWAGITQPRQNKFMGNIIKAHKNNICWRRSRRFVVSALGDATAYQQIGTGVSSTYTKINNRVKDEIYDLFYRQLKQKACPLVVMAHSLGGHIISSYIWDIQHGKISPQNQNDFENMRYLAGMLTFGCNIPLFTFAHNPKDLKPIKFPGENLTDGETEVAKWINFYCPADILGYPLKPIYPNLHHLEDKAIDVGRWWQWWNPLSHRGYWTDNNMLKPAAEFIVKLQKSRP